MRIRNTHLTYCLNVHPGESWEQNLAAIGSDAMEVRRQVAPGQPFGLGLRLSDAASRELVADDELERFKDFLAAGDLYAFTINGFPFGAFHGQAVKDNVYRPDWSDAARADYTIRLLDILAELLPPGVEGSISTVPLSYKHWPRSPGALAAMCENLARCAAHAADILERTGRLIVVAPEPEPDCLLETLDETLAFFDGPLMKLGSAGLGRQGIGASAAQAMLRRHVGVCTDTAHQAVQFEQPAASIRRLVDAGVTIGKIQLSAALEADATRESLAAVARFDEPTYLHQTNVRLGDGRLLRYPDLRAALVDDAARQSGATWRVHFHVPLFAGQLGPLRSTNYLLDDDLAALLAQTGPDGQAICSNVEIETYTFGVLPPDLRPERLTDGIAREFQWTRRQLMTQEGPR